MTNFALKPRLLGAALGLALLLSGANATAGHAVDLGSASGFAILAKSGIAAGGTTFITGNIGVSPIDSSGITGFALIADASNQFSTSSLLNGRAYASDYAPPTPAGLTTAIGDMQTAYTDAAGRAADVTGLGAGTIGGLVLAPGVYKWGTNVLIDTDVTLNGASTAVWIFQIDGTLTLDSGRQVLLAGGAQARNIFWQVAGQVTLHSTSVMQGNILGQTAIVLNTGATLNGRALAQTAVTMDAAIVTSPGGIAAGKTFAFPSPARGERVNFAYSMAESGKADIRVYNEAGDLVARIQDDKLIGTQTSRLSVRDFAPGVYIYKVLLTYASGKVESLEVQKFAVRK
jgi:hypothetical protein